MPLATVTVAGTITAPDGTPFARKTVWFTTTAEMVDAAGNVLYPITRIQARVITGELKAADGTSPLVLVDSDAGLGTVPYVIEESWANGRKFTVNLTASMVVSGHIPYSTLGPVTPPPTAVSPYALLSDVETRDAATLTIAEAHADSGDAAEVTARNTAITTAISPLATSSALTSGLAGKAPLTGPFAPTSTGATSTTRYVGGTTSGAPTTGTFAVGDYVVTQDAKIYVCVSAGTPGTWRRQGAGFLLATGAYTSSTDPATITADGTFKDVDAALTMTIPANVPFCCDILGTFVVTQGTVVAGANVAVNVRVIDGAFGGSTGTTEFGRWGDKKQFASASGSGLGMSWTVMSSDEQSALGSDTAVKLQANATTNLTSCKFTTSGGIKAIRIRAVAR